MFRGKTIFKDKTTKIAVIGGNVSTLTLLKKLSQYGFVNVKVWSFVTENKIETSGWTDLHGHSKELGFMSTKFQKLIDCENEIVEFKPSVLFAVGLSQLIPKKILDVPNCLSIGFHPTALPKGRGRAPLAWLILNQEDGAATFFKLTEHIDDGDILVQIPFQTSIEDDASSIEEKMLLAEETALDYLFSEEGDQPITGFRQNHLEASWTGQRKPEDGRIDWQSECSDILKLIRAATAPHPGAFSFYKEHKITIWKAERSDDFSIKGVIGRVVYVSEEGKNIFVQCRNGVIKITNWESKSWVPKIGHKLGYDPEIEIFYLRKEIFRLRKELREKGLM